MSASRGFLELLEDLLSPLGPISVRRMFGGAGIYCDGHVFAFVDDDQLFLKTDEAGRAAFEAEGMGPFTYTTKHGPGTLMSYWRAPERLFDDPDEMVAWARTALGVARRAPTKSASRRKEESTALQRRRAPRGKRAPNKEESQGTRAAGLTPPLRDLAYSLATLSGRVGFLRKAGTLSAKPAAGDGWSART